jgi:membrane protein
MQHLDRLLARPRVERAVRVAREVVIEMREDRVTALAAEVAFFAQLSVLPLLLVLVAVLGLLEPLGAGNLSEDVERVVIDALRDALGSEDGTLVDAVRSLFAESSPGLLTVGVLGALWSGSKAFVGMASALDVVYDLDENRGWLRMRRDALLLAFASIVALSLGALVLVTGPLLGVGQAAADWLGLGSGFSQVWQFLQPPIAVLLAIGWMATLLHAAPDHHTPWRADLPGAILGAIWCLLATRGLRIYFAFASDGNAVYGALGGVLSFALWIYLLVLGVLIGGELNQVLSQSPSRAPART